MQIIVHLKVISESAFKNCRINGLHINHLAIVPKIYPGVQLGLDQECVLYTKIKQRNHIYTKISRFYNSFYEALLTCKSCLLRPLSSSFLLSPASEFILECGNLNEINKENNQLKSELAFILKFWVLTLSHKCALENKLLNQNW